MTCKNSIEVNGVETKVSTKDGICGYLPVFRTLKYAEKFAKNKYQILPVSAFVEAKKGES